jgi:hypothetical protein
MMTTPYFPIFEPNQNEEYFPEYPFTESKFGKGYSQRITDGYTIERWKTRFRIFSTWPRLTRWRAEKVYAVGDVVKKTGSTPGDYVYQCVIAGTSHGTTEPTWPTTEENTIIDNTVTWVCWSKNQITALLNFVAARKGHVGSFNVWIPILSNWKLMMFPVEPVHLTPARSGLYCIVDVEIEFEGVFSFESEDS